MNFKNLPENWKVVRLGRVADITPAVYKEKKTKEVFFIPMELVPQDEKLYADFEIRKHKEVKSGVPVYPNDLLLAKITPCFENGKIGFVPQKFGIFIATTEIHPIRSKGTIDLMFLYYLLRHPEIKEYLKNQMTGTSGRKRIPKNALVSLSIPLPPHPEQK
ncbi:MAG TPA: restriction endonuclease subunit S, partial [Candidatus Aerophobetes bacterium]|nr:restriction endonuclease subunit S [Candidatus Aerophobetes bacterium]